MNICIMRLTTGKKRERGAEDYLKEFGELKTPQVLGRYGYPSTGNSKDLKQDQSKEDHSETHYNHDVKSQGQGENFECSKRKAIHTTQGNPQKGM